MTKVDDTPENRTTCWKYCGTCPSKPDVPEEILFCALGKSAKEVKKIRCNCPGCGVHAKYHLKNMYFCENGAAE